jgi:dTDP-4-dehydrorhamnose reductase
VLPVKTAVIGATGFIGRHLLAAYRSSYPDCVGTGFSGGGPGLSFFDIRKPKLELLRLEETGHRAILIAAGKSSVALCERERDVTRAINVDGTLDLVRQAGRTALQVIFLSSDYVFDGRAGRYHDHAETTPATEYGRQKASVEKEIPSLTANSLILRLSKIYGVQKGDGTLLDEMAYSLATGRQLLAAKDQIFNPTYIEDLVHAIATIQAKGLTGILNLCSPETWARYDVAVAVARAMRADLGRVSAIKLHELAPSENRPLNTSMVCSRLEAETRLSFTPLLQCVDQVASNWKET